MISHQGRGDARPGGRPERLIGLMRAAIQRCALDLSDTVVFTEAGTGAYVVTPVLAAMAAAQRVFAVARPSRYGTAEEAARATFDLARLAQVDARLEVVFEKRAELVARADVVTNSGHVRPIDAEMVGWMKPSAVIPLMYEAWEYRDADVDLGACRQRGIPVAGTNERHPAVDVFAFLGMMALRLLSDAGIAAPHSRVVVWCDNPFRPFLVQDLERAGATVDSVERLEDAVDPAHTEAILVAVQPRADPVVGSCEAQTIADRYPGALVAQFWGDLDRAALTRSGVPFWPLEPPPPGHQGILPSSIGPEPIVRLQSGGLKVGQVMAQARRSRAGRHTLRDDAIAAAVISGFGQALAVDALRRLGGE